MQEDKIEQRVEGTTPVMDAIGMADGPIQVEKQVDRPVKDLTVEEDGTGTGSEVSTEIKSAGFSLNDLASPEKTQYEMYDPSCDPELPLDRKPRIGVFFSGCTPDSKEWRKIEREIMNPDEKSTSLFLHKGGQKSSIEMDPDMADKRRRLLIRSIDNIWGISDFEFSSGSKGALLSQPKYQWMLEQWGDHLDARASFFKKPATTV